MTVINTTASINALEAQMNAIIGHFGEDACIAHAEKVYSQSFRSDPVRICDHLNNSNLSMEEYYAEFNEIADELWSSLKSELYTRCTGIACPQIEDDMGYDDPYYDSMVMSIGYEQENWNDRRDAWVKDNDLHSENFINETTEIAFLCNYKGEGEGSVELFTSQIKKLPVFVSKRESFNI